MQHKDVTTINQCRISDSNELVPVLHLGNQPLANALRPESEKDQEEFKVPLRIVYNPESKLVQLAETVSKERLFQEYVWVTGTSKGANEYAQIFFNHVKETAGLKAEDFIAEIASNDGTFLKVFIENGFENVLGIDPASNIVEMAEANGVRSLNAFWSYDTSNKVVADHGHAKVVFARNVIPHVEELKDVIKGMANVMAEDGMGAIEFHYGGEILDGNQYDSIYHEHLCYFTIESISYLLAQYGLKSFHITESPISGGSYVIYFAKQEREKTASFHKALKEENDKGVNGLEAWQAFADRAKKHKQDTIDALNQFKGQKIAGFGASARSSTYLNFCEVDDKILDVIIDNNPLKHHKLAPGTNVSIVPFKEGMDRQPDVIFLLAWNFKEEIKDELRAAGFKGKVIVPFPEVVIEEL